MKKKIASILGGLLLLLQTGAAFPGVYDDLLKAIEDNNTSEVTAILQRGMDVNTVDKSGNTLLILAVEKGNLDLVKFLIGHRARVHSRNQYGDTALMMAALKGQLEMAQLLVASGAEINHSGWTPLAYAAFGGHAQVVEFLIEDRKSVV